MSPFRPYDPQQILLSRAPACGCEHKRFCIVILNTGVKDRGQRGRDRGIQRSPRIEKSMS